MEQHPEASEEQLAALRAEMNQIKAEMVQLERQKTDLTKQSRRLEDRQVKNWKWMHEASKFSGISSISFTCFRCRDCSFKQGSRLANVASNRVPSIFIRCG